MFDRSADLNPRSAAADLKQSGRARNNIRCGTISTGYTLVRKFPYYIAYANFPW